MGLAHVEAGSSIGSYVLERKLGAGGMAEVYLARRSGPHGFSKRVAIKRILPELSGDSQLIRMFCHEARVAATLSHPNIAQIIEFGEHEGELFIVMEYVDGVSCSALLRTVVGRDQAVPVGPALYIAREVLLALACAHGALDEHDRPAGVVHRDVSPSNILVSRTGTVKLIDFGITKSLLAERRTHPGDLKGKLRYMSPEQVLGGDVDARSDLFAVGIVLAEMLLGRALFAGGSDLEILTRITRGEIGLVRDGTLPQDLAELLEAALAHRVGDRFQSARDFARTIEDVAAVRGLRLDDTVIVPYLHSLGILPSSSGTRPSAEAAAAPSRAVPPPLPRQSRPELPAASGAGALPRPPSPTILDVEPPRRQISVTPRGRPTLVPPIFAARKEAALPAADAALVEPEAPRAEAPPRPAARSDVHPSPGGGARHPTGTYRLRTKSGSMLGPFGRAEMLGMLATGRLSSRSSVSLDGDSFVAASTIPALSALAVHPAFRFKEDDDASPEWLARIGSVDIPSALYRLAMQRRTGLLVAVDGKRRKRVFLDRGDPVFVASTNRDELLGRRLLASGAITEQILEVALGRQPPLRIGEALVSLGAIQAPQLVRELSAQLEERLIELGRWRAGELRFFPGKTLDGSCHVKTLEPALPLVTRLIREEYAAGDIAALLRPLIKEQLTLGPTYRTMAPLLGLTPDETRALAFAEGLVPVRDVVTRATQSGLAMADALRAVFIGLSAGVLRVAGWPPGPGVQPKADG